jgi:hypothetical protein
MRGDERVSTDEYRKALEEQYQGEVAGEVSVCRMLQSFESPRQRYVLGSILQLETETKARLRPSVAKLGISLVESEAARADGEGLAHLVNGLSWQDAMRALAEALEGFVNRYREIAQLAPPEFKDLADSMVIHEESLLNLARCEAVGIDDGSLDALVDQLVFPLPELAGADSGQ